ncbi:response regulator transcription factor [Parabacteroides goldsteinii]|uniref:response regulator transcription factor n=1 Tax=Parabacteroides goldsteinii TaxID=328812 RepID=UPI002430360E|nr:helix-turn-helix transcriptional regulator [Parabacteroides goldsteinii]
MKQSNILTYDFLSSMMTEAIVVLDFAQNSFQYIPNNDLILCGYTQEALKDLGSDFFKKIIHPKDISFWGDIYDAILKYLSSEELPIDQVNYFSFLLRIKSSLSSKRKSDYIMTYVKLKPQWLEEQLRYGICLFSVSIRRKQDNQLYVHYKNMDYSDYSFKTKKWKHHQFIPLSKRQKEMLICAQQGLSLKETAEKMNVADKTIESIRWTLFEKFGVNTIEQAIQYASNRRLIYHSPATYSKTISGMNKQKQKK